jgi:hypothetical protein
VDGIRVVDESAAMILSDSAGTELEYTVTIMPYVLELEFGKKALKILTILIAKYLFYTFLLLTSSVGFKFNCVKELNTIIFF